jgi:hypothetical protein
MQQARMLQFLNPSVVVSLLCQIQLLIESDLIGLIGRYYMLQSVI